MSVVRKHNPYIITVMLMSLRRNAIAIDCVYQTINRQQRFPSLNITDNSLTKNSAVRLEILIKLHDRSNWPRQKQ